MDGQAATDLSCGSCLVKSVRWNIRLGDTLASCWYFLVIDRLSKSIIVDPADMPASDPSTSIKEGEGEYPMNARFPKIREIKKVSKVGRNSISSEASRSNLSSLIILPLPRPLASGREVPLPQEEVAQQNSRLLRARARKAS